MWGSHKWGSFSNTAAHSVVSPWEEKQPCWGDKKGKTLNEAPCLTLLPRGASQPPRRQWDAGAVVFRNISLSPKPLLEVSCHRVPKSTVRDSFF